MRYTYLESPRLAQSGMLTFCAYILSFCSALHVDDMNGWNEVCHFHMLRACNRKSDFRIMQSIFAVWMRWCWKTREKTRTTGTSKKHTLGANKKVELLQPKQSHIRNAWNTRSSVGVTACLTIFGNCWKLSWNMEMHSYCMCVCVCMKRKGGGAVCAKHNKSVSALPR